MKKIISFTMCVLFVLYLSGCVVISISDSKTVTGKGSKEKYNYLFDSYDRFRAEGNFEIQYNASPLCSLTLEIQPNLREYINTEVKDGELVVRTTKQISKSSTPVLTVYAPVLNGLTITGICTFSANDIIKTNTFNLIINGACTGSAEFDVKNLNAVMSGAGDFELSGKADNAEIIMSGAGEIDAFSLQINKASVILSGSGSIKINCSDVLSINANGTGEVEYKGSPTLSLKKNGLVSITKVD